MEDENTVSLCSKHLISLIIPVYCNESSLILLYKTLIDQVTNNTLYDYEVLFIDDGSSDNSYDVLRKIKMDSSIVKLIKLTRNFGQANAIKAGYDYSKGDYIVIMSADLQDPPQLINNMLCSALGGGYDIVIGTRRSRKESLYRIWSSKVFYYLMKVFAFRDMPSGGFDYLLMSKRVKDIINSTYEANPFFQGQFYFTGYKTHLIEYDRLDRKGGKSKWTIAKKITALVDSIVSYSYLPVRGMTILGLVTAIFGILYAITIVIAYYSGNSPFPGWAPIMIVVLVLSGIQMIMLGVIGEYVWRTLEQVRRRPKYVVDEIQD